MICRVQGCACVKWSYWSWLLQDGPEQKAKQHSTEAGAICSWSSSPDALLPGLPWCLGPGAHLHLSHLTDLVIVKPSRPCHNVMPRRSMITLMTLDQCKACSSSRFCMKKTTAAAAYSAWDSEVPWHIKHFCCYCCVVSAWQSFLARVSCRHALKSC